MYFKCVPVLLLSQSDWIYTKLYHPEEQYQRLTLRVRVGWVVGLDLTKVIQLVTAQVNKQIIIASP